MYNLALPLTPGFCLQVCQSAACTAIGVVECVKAGASALPRDGNNNVGCGNTGERSYIPLVLPLQPESRGECTFAWQPHAAASEVPAHCPPTLWSGRIALRAHAPASVLAGTNNIGSNNSGSNNRGNGNSGSGNWGDDNSGR